MLRYERALLAGGILLLAVLSWAYLLKNSAMEPMQPPLGALAAMWWIMMVAMMLPSAAPAILLYARVRHVRRDAAIAEPWVFLAGYLFAWLCFSIVAALAQWWLIGAGIAQGRVAQGSLLIAAGLYQMSPLKAACLTQCRSPAQFIIRHSRPGRGSSIRLGILHGAYCVGCCWVLMALLFVGGVMNLLWVVGLATVVAGEKLMRNGQTLRIISAIGLLTWGVVKFLG